MSYIYCYSFQHQTELLVLFNNIQSYSIKRTLFSVIEIYFLIWLNKYHYLPVITLLSYNILPFTSTWKVIKIYLLNLDLTQNTQGRVNPYSNSIVRVNPLTRLYPFIYLFWRLLIFLCSVVHHKTLLEVVGKSATIP